MSSRSSGKKRPSNKSSSKPEPWSEWTWDSVQAKYYKVRRDATGKWEYYWDDTQTPRTISEDTSSRNAAYPKTDDSVDTLTGGFSNASLTTSSKEYSSPHYITSGSPVASSHSNPASSNLSGSSNTTADYASGPSYTANAASSSSVIQSGFDTGADGRSQPISIASGSGRAAYQSMAQSGGYANNYGNMTDSGPSGNFGTSSADMYQGEGSSYDSYSATPTAHNSFIPASTRSTRERDDYPSGPSTRQSKAPETSGSGAITPKDIHRVIKGTRGEKEKLDSKFKIHNSKYFKPGEVFKVLWYEPKGGNPNATEVTAVEQDGNDNSKFGEQSFAKIRRFVIVAGDHGHCQCVPILTYQNQGTLKGGAKVEEHAIIYTGDRPPKPIEGEEAPPNRPIQVVSKTHRDKLDKASRVNYAKIYTVEHNVKVQFIGRIAESDRFRFNADFDATWARKRTMSASEWT